MLPTMKLGSAILVMLYLKQGTQMPRFFGMFETRAYLPALLGILLPGDYD